MRKELDLRTLVAKSLSPGVRLQRTAERLSDATWWFEFSWSGQNFELVIPRDDWEQKRRQLISLRARLAAPAPEATRGGRQFWVSLHDRCVVGDTAKYVFALYSQPRGRPTFVSVPLTTAAELALANQGRQAGYEPHAYPLAAALWYLKSHMDEGRHGGRAIDHVEVAALMIREVAPEADVRAYVARKLHQAYQAAGEGFCLRFDWTDLEYLGISGNDFMRAISPRAGKDWVVSRLGLSPTREFLEKCDAEPHEESRTLKTAS